jgi:predicted PurR-regulated permease PerM
VIKTVMSLLTGILIACWLWLFGVPYAGLWGMLAFLLNYIPNIGSIIAAIPAVMVAWLDLGLLVSVAASIGYIVVNMGVGNILEPRVLGRGMGLSALVVFCSMIFWGWALGPIGMLLSVPLTMTARVAFEGFEDTRWLGTLLGDAE